jgi:amidase
MDAADLVFAGPLRQAELVAAGDVTPRALVDACLDRIEHLDPQLNAFRVVLAEQARADADALGEPDGRPLFGVPVAIKDDQDVAGQATRFGTGLAPAPAERDGELVRRLREAGAIVVGKTNVPELTIWPWTESAAQGITRNPWRQDRITGGSSGGSAAAVAAGMVGVATASDGLGSIRIPAACCGLFGLKPQKDRVSIAPKTAATGWHGLTHYGVLTRGVRDAAYVLDAVADRRPAEPFLSAAGRTPMRLRVALSFKTPPMVRAKLDREVRGAVESVAGTLRELGHEVVERDAPFEAGPFLRGISRWFRGIRDDAIATGQVGGLERKTQGMKRVGDVTPARRVAKSRREEREYAARLDAFFDDVDVLLTPLTAIPPFAVGTTLERGTLWAYNRASTFVPYPGPWNVTGQPAASVPAGWSADGVPLAAQLVARTDGEGTLLSLAAQLEEARRWTDRRPPSS